MQKHDAPSFAFFPRDFLADKNVTLMSNEEAGIYIKLISHCWIEGELPGELADLEALSRGNPSPNGVRWGSILRCFQKRGDNLIHKRLEIERDKQLLRRLSAQSRGAQGARARWGGAQEDPPPAAPPPKAPKKPPAEKKAAEKKIAYADNVLMTEAEHAKLVADHGEALTAELIAKLSAHKHARGQTYKSDYHAMHSWVIDAVTKKRGGRGCAPQEGEGLI